MWIIIGGNELKAGLVYNANIEDAEILLHCCKINES